MAFAFALLALAGCERREPAPALESSGPDQERVTLGASFVGADSSRLRHLLHSDLVVQRPAPDSALGGAAAIEYLLQLAANTSVAESRLQTGAMAREGSFLFEKGLWLLREGDLALQAGYTLRWRETPGGWQVVLWRWNPFR